MQNKKESYDSFFVWEQIVAILIFFKQNKNCYIPKNLTMRIADPTTRSPFPFF
jgi:hypothetical protein